MIDYSEHYHFPGPFEPMDNQVQRFNFLLNNQYAFDFSQMGTGKTVTALWAADYLMRETGGSTLILAPLTILESVWKKAIDDIVCNSDRLNMHVLSKSSNSRASRIRSTNNSFYITNFESILSRDFREAVGESDISTIIIDECTAFKHANTRRSRYIRVLAAGRNVWGLTATPMPNSPLNAYGIARAIRQDYTETLTRFRGRTHAKQGQWQWVPRPGAVADAYEILQPSIRIERAACYAIPAQTTETRIVALSDDCKRLYGQLRKHAHAELASGATISVAHEAALRNKLLQVAGGAVYTTGGTEELKPGGRASELIDLLDQTDEKLVVIVPFRSQLNLVVETCRTKGYSAVAIHGDTNLKDRTKYIDLFQRTKHPRVIVADPRVLSHGVELTEASIIVWWLPIDSAEHYEQAIGRLTRRGQANHVRVIQLCGTKLERSIYERLENRQSLQGVLLDAIREEGMSKSKGAEGERVQFA